MRLIHAVGELNADGRPRVETVALCTDAEFDSVHSIQRARQVGSVDSIIRPEDLRPRTIATVERGLA